MGSCKGRESQPGGPARIPCRALLSGLHAEPKSGACRGHWGALGSKSQSPNLRRTVCVDVWLALAAMLCSAHAQVVVAYVRLGTLLELTPNSLVLTEGDCLS